MKPLGAVPAPEGELAVKRHFLSILATFGLTFAAAAQSTSFIYQGRLKNGAQSAAGLHANPESENRP